VAGLVQVIFRAITAEDVDLFMNLLPTANSPSGDLYISVLDQNPESTVSFEFKRPEDLFAYGGTMASEGQYA
jgi:hypothetical protein